LGCHCPTPEVRRTAPQKNRFPLWLVDFFHGLYFLLPIGAAYAPGLFKLKIIGNINFGYLFALSQFFVSWGIAMYYAKVANQKFDRLTQELIDELQ
jgi:uncharacterized membrane protein (DUF485 family)